MALNDKRGEQQAPAPGVTTANNEAVSGLNQAGMETEVDIFGGFYGAPIQASLGSEVVKNLHEAFVESFKKASPKYEIFVIDIDREIHTALKFSAIVIALREKAIQERLGYITLIVEGSGEELKPYYETSNGQQFEVLRSTNEAYDETLIKIVSDAVKSQVPTAKVFFPLEAVVVPRTFDPENKAAVKELAFYASSAVTNELFTTKPKFPDLNLEHVRNLSNNAFNITMKVDHTPRMDAVGLPYRADVRLEFQTISPNKQSRSIVNNGDRESTFAELTGYIDLVWDPVVADLSPLQGQIQQPQLAPGQMITQKYRPRFVITNIKSRYGYTPASLLLNILPVVALSQHSNWFQAFRPDASTDEFNLRDPGALGIEANLANDPTGFGPKIDTRSSEFTLGNLGSLLSSTIRPELLISIDVPEGGLMTPFLSLFAAASVGSQRAKSVLLNAASILTNNRFGNGYQGAIFDDLDNRVHLGYWVDSKGVKHDIREIDYLGVLNLSGNNPELIRKWSDTFNVRSGDTRKELATRRQMISAFTGEKAVFTGFARRVTIHSDFFIQLFNAAAESGIHPSVQTPLTTDQFNNARAGGQFSQNVGLSPNLAFQPRAPQGQSFTSPNQFGRFS